jgi:hypothetical protein
MFRDDLGAAIARIDALEAELAALKSEHEALVDRISSKRLYHFIGDESEKQIDAGREELFGARGVLVSFNHVGQMGRQRMLSGHPLRAYDT